MKYQVSRPFRTREGVCYTPEPFSTLSNLTSTENRSFMKGKVLLMHSTGNAFSIIFLNMTSVSLKVGQGQPFDQTWYRSSKG